MIPELNSAQRKFLRGQAHPLEAVIQVGAAGLQEGVVSATSEALDRHELIKVKLQRAEKASRGRTARELAEATDSALCQLIGRIAVLYRPRKKDLPDKPRIALP